MLKPICHWYRQQLNWPPESNAIVAFDTMKNEIFIRTFYVLSFSRFMIADPLSLCQRVSRGEELEAILHKECAITSKLSFPSRWTPAQIVQLKATPLPLPSASSCGFPADFADCKVMQNCSETKVHCFVPGFITRSSKLQCWPLATASLRSMEAL